MRIAIIGAGIGGLVAAAGLQAGGHEVTVYEQRSGPTAEGAGLTLFGNARTALAELGLAAAVDAVSSGAIAAMRAGQRSPSGSWLLTVPAGSVSELRSVHRVDLHRVLSEQLEPGTIRYGQRALVSGDGTPHLSVGSSTEHFDLVVAADGIRSPNRARLGLDPGLCYAGYTAWRGVTSRQVDVHAEAGETWGRGQIFGIVPLSDGRVYWFGTLNVPAGTVFPDEHAAALRHFGEWHDPIRECIAATPPAEVLRHDVYDLARPLASFVRGRTVLLGDAAHAMTPNLGQGAGQGIEDAATLALLLRGVKGGGATDSRATEDRSGGGATGDRRDDLDATLARYSDIRRARTSVVMRRSRLAGRVAQASGLATVALRDAVLRLAPGALVGGLSSRIASWPQPRE